MTSHFARSAAALALALGLAACADKEPEAVQSSLIQPDCYTVDPYQPIPISKPKKDVPESSAAFLGAWGGGAWDGSICHDLWVMEVSADGAVLMFDAHGPGFFPDATAFTRKGEIGKDGRLRVRKGPATVEYYIKDGRLYGERHIGEKTNHIIMNRQG